MAKARRFGFERAAVALLIGGMAAALMAQGTGGLTGQAIDEQGKPLAGYTVVVQDLQTHYISKTKTNNKGIYILLGLPYHPYKVTLKDPSGKELWFVDNQSLLVGSTTSVDFNLKKKPARAGGGEVAGPSTQWNYVGGRTTSWEGGSSKRNRKELIALVDRAKGEAGAGQLEQAAADFQQAIQLSPTDAYLENELGRVYVGLNRVEEAVQAFQKAADLDPENAGVFYFNMGTVLAIHGQLDAALPPLKKSIQADPNNAEAYYWEGQAMIVKAEPLPNGKLDAPPGTVEAYQKYLELAPNGPHAVEVKQMLQMISPGKEGRQ